MSNTKQTYRITQTTLDYYLPNEAGIAQRCNEIGYPATTWSYDITIDDDVDPADADGGTYYDYPAKGAEKSIAEGEYNDADITYHNYREISKQPYTQADEDNPITLPQKVQ